MWENQIPFGKLTQNYGKSPFSMGKSTISMAFFSSFLLVYQRVNEHHVPFAMACPHRFCMEKQAEKSADNRSQEQCLRHDLGTSLFFRWETGSSVQQNWLIMGCATMKTLEKDVLFRNFQQDVPWRFHGVTFLLVVEMGQCSYPSHGRTKDLEVSRGFWENQSLEFSGA